MDVPKHHTRQTVCATRLPYRDGRVPKAVKVYTVNNESRYLLVQGVPSVGAGANLLQLFSRYGLVDEHYPLDEYPSEDKYTEVYLFKFNKIQSARFAKRKLDDYSFFGGMLHICYAPEYESVQETREKLRDRRRVIDRKITQQAQATKSQLTSSLKQPQHSASFTQDPTMHSVTESGLSRTNIVHLDDRAVYLPHQPPPIPPHVFHTISVKDNDHQNGSKFFTNGMSFQKRGNLSMSENEVTTPDYNNPETNAQWSLQNFHIPEPSKQLPQHLMTQNRLSRKRSHEFSRVPSAHAGLPPGFDGRLSPQISKHDLAIPGTDKDLPKSNSKNLQHQSIIRNFTPKTAPPKFVPRQAMKRKSDGEKAQSDDVLLTLGKGSSKDALDEQLRQNAFRLGKVQGPENIIAKKETVKVDPGIEKSMISTIKSIRSKISQVISDTVKKPS